MPDRAEKPCLHAAPKPAPGVFFVATNGNDLWSGRLPAPNRKGTDGPFATLPAALDGRSCLKATGGNAAEPAHEGLRGGGRISWTSHSC